MITESHLQRARQLLEINRQEQAIEELLIVLSTDPDNVDALYMIVHCFIEVKNNDKAQEYWQGLVQVAPSNSVTHYYHAIILDRFKKAKDSEAAIWHAIQLNPHEAAYWAFLSALYIDKKEWEKALEYANKGLAIDPEHTTSLNHRTLCLTKLNRKEELYDSINDALHADPHDSYTHANIGWTQLENNEPEEAIKHFREALRLNPSQFYAREGMKEAIKGRNPIYRAFLNYAFWISKQQSVMQWVVILVIFLSQRILPEPFSTIVTILVIASWLITPLANFVLLFDKDGKYLLSNLQKNGAIAVSFFIAVSIIGLITGLLIKSIDTIYILGLFGVFASLPITGMIASEERFKIGWVKALGFGLPALGIIAIGAWAIDNLRVFDMAWQCFVMGSALSTWVFALNKN